MVLLLRHHMCRLLHNMCHWLLNHTCLSHMQLLPNDLYLLFEQLIFTLQRLYLILISHLTLPVIVTSAVTVKIIESAPMSKKKRWTLVEVVEKSREVDVAAMRAARKQADAEAEAGVSSEAAKPSEPETAPAPESEAPADSE